MLEKLLTTLFILLFGLTPLLWAPLNYELFEYNKMMFVYLLTVLIGASWFVKMITSKKLILKRTLLDVPLLLFLAANALSTFFSTDQHVSLWGYYSRSNGGLISTICFIFLYYALISNYELRETKKFLKAMLFGGAIVALYAIPEHFGVSPSCLMLTGQPSASCWVQDVQARVFSTMGQPNWLGAYLVILIFPTLYFLQTARSRFQTVFYLLLSIIYYLAFTFTYSRGATFGLIAGLGVFIVLQTLASHLRGVKLFPPPGWKLLATVLLSFLLINLIFGFALTSRQDFIQPSKTGSSNVTQLESGGTESGTIRLIVWGGALEIFKHYPIFGSGVETFANSYYQYRPKEHNLVSEWDFLYNKAHNEYLNYLATTGLLGFVSYLALIGTFLIWAMGQVLGIKGRKQKTQDTYYLALIPAVAASYTSYLVQNIFGFSVVIIALLFYILPAFILERQDVNIVFLRVNKIQLLNFFGAILTKRIIYQRVLIVITISIAFYLIYKLASFWVADTYFSSGTSYTNEGNPGQGYNLLLDATNLNKNEPFYRSELSYSAAAAAVSLQEIDATLSAQIKDVAILENDRVLHSSPNNVSLWRTAIRTYYQLASIDPGFNQKTLDAFDKAITLAPTDPKLYQSKAQVLNALGRNDEAIKVLKKATELKPNYKDSYLALGKIYQEQGNKQKALESYNIVLKLVPNDQEALELIQSLDQN